MAEPSYKKKKKTIDGWNLTQLWSFWSKTKPCAHWRFYTQLGGLWYA